MSVVAAKKPATTPNPLAKTYGERPVPFQFPENPEKMYIGSEVRFSMLTGFGFDFALSRPRWATIYVYFEEHSIRSTHRYGAV